MAALYNGDYVQYNHGESIFGCWKFAHAGPSLRDGGHSARKSEQLQQRVQPWWLALLGWLSCANQFSAL